MNTGPVPLALTFSIFKAKLTQMYFDKTFAKLAVLKNIIAKHTNFDNTFAKQ